ncbi:MAG: lipid-A-disaccharide synthase-related protein, partial [Microcoleaceae cyanobacterium]
ANVQDHIQGHPKDYCFTWNTASLTLSQHRFNDFLHQADLAIAMAGTATEQFVGLGKPAIALPGRGPQFTEQFAEAQSRLLGESLILVADPIKVPEVVKSLLHNPDRLHQIAENGRQRMGQPGAARRIAECLLERLAPD